MQHALKAASILMLLLCFTLSADAAVFAVDKAATKSTLLEKFGTDDVQEFMALSPKEMGKRRGERLTFKEKMAVKLVKRQIRKAERRGQEVSLESASQNAASDFNIGGFLLGFLLGLIGVLLALIIDKDLVNSALIGLGVWVVILILIVL